MEETKKRTRKATVAKETKTAEKASTAKKQQRKNCGKKVCSSENRRFFGSVNWISICSVRERIMTFTKSWVRIRPGEEEKTAFISLSGHLMRRMSM